MAYPLAAVLRDSNGALWFVRNGQIVCVGNHAQDWARVLLDIPVVYDQNIERASQLLLDTARELRHRIKAVFDEHGVRIPYTQQAIIHTNGAASGTGATLGD